MSSIYPSSNLHDLQLEDIEDFAPAQPQDDRHHTSDEDEAIPHGAVLKPEKRTRVRHVVYLMRKHKWVTALSFVVFVIAIALFSIIGSTSRKVPEKKTGIIHTDPKSLDPTITEALMEKLIEIYGHHGLDSAPLGATAGVTAQKKAFYWLAANKNVLGMDHTVLTQRYALAVLYYSTNAVKTEYVESPKPWISAHLWLSESDVCEWRGIICNNLAHVEEIKLERNNLSGRLPMELKILSSTLHTLDLSSNDIAMVGSEYNVFTEMTQMHTLLMDDNYLFHDNGLPSQFKSMERMQKVRLSYNLFEGPLDGHGVLSSWTKLTHLEIESNYVSGSIPSVLGQMSNLVYVYLRRNNLNGNLNFLKTGQLKDLFAIWLDNNALSGSIPTEIGALTELAAISFTNCSLAGTIPTEMGNLAELQRLWLYDNKLSGDIPTQMSLLKKLDMVEVHHNNLNGSMPTGVCQTITQSSLAHKSLTSDCKSKLTCSSPGCCTTCY